MLGVLVGAMLAAAGVLLQDSLRNALASPDLLGVTSGATIVVAAIVVFGVPLPLATYPWLALGGGLLAGFVVIASTRHFPDPVRVILVGAALSAVLGAGVFMIITVAESSGVVLIYHYLLGDLAARTWDYVTLIAPYALIELPLALASSAQLNLLKLGDDVATSLGLRVVRTRLALMVPASAMVAAVVSVAGSVPWVALLAPRLARWLLGNDDSRRTLPVAAGVGALLVPAADLLAHRTFPPLELPMGVWLSLLGGPFLLVLLRREMWASG